MAGRMVPRRRRRHSFQPLFSLAEPQTSDLMDMSMWPFLLNLVEDEHEMEQVESAGMEKQPMDRSMCRIMKNPIDPVYTVVEVKGNMFNISMPLGKDFKPENLDVKVKDRHVIIQIKMEQISDDGTSHLAQVFTKRIPLPEEAKLEDIKSHLTNEGVFKLKAPMQMPQQPPRPQAVDIPVEIDMENAPPA